MTRKILTPALIQGSSTSAAALEVDNLAATTFLPVFNAFGPNMTDGQQALFLVGRSASTDDCGQVGVRVGSSPVMNFGFFGEANNVNFTPAAALWTGPIDITSARSVLDDGSGNTRLGGGLATKVRTVTTSPSVSATDSLVLLNGTTLTATLPTAAGITGRQYTVKLIAASTTGTVATTSSQTIDGSTTYSLSARYKYVTVVSDGANWYVTANN